jgi:acetyl esterase/lipase
MTARPSIASDAVAPSPAAAPFNAMPDYVPSDGVGLYLTSYLRWLPRSSGALRYRVMMWLLRRFGRLNLDGGTDLVAMREKLQRKDERMSRVPRWAACSAISAGGVVSEWVQAGAADPGRVVLYLHGGAFAFRFPNTHRAFAARLSRMLRARALLPDYRLAPESMFPEPLDDCICAYRWLLAQGAAAAQIVVAGDSAGGNLALGLLLRLQREGLPQPAAAVVLSPATDASISGGTLVTRAAFDPMLPPEIFPLLIDRCIDPQWRSDPTASPLLGDFAGLAPILIQVGTSEVLLDDARRIAQRIHEGGGHAMCEVWNDMPHVFPLIPYLKESTAAINNIGRFVVAHTGWDIAPEQAPR